MATLAPAHFDDATALIVVDVQHDFADPNGGLYVRDGEAVVPVINDLITAAQAAGATIVYTQDWHPPRTPHFAIDGGTWPVHCVRDTWGAEFHRDLHVTDDALIVRKGVDGGDGYSGFSVRDPISGHTTSTALGRMLEDRNITRLVIVGLAGDVCVKATAIDARALGWEVTVPIDTTRFVELSDGDATSAVNDMRAAGVTVVDQLPLTADGESADRD